MFEPGEPGGQTRRSLRLKVTNRICGGDDAGDSVAVIKVDDSGSLQFAPANLKHGPYQAAQAQNKTERTDSEDRPIRHLFSPCHKANIDARRYDGWNPNSDEDAGILVRSHPDTKPQGNRK